MPDEKIPFTIHFPRYLEPVMPSILALFEGEGSPDLLGIGFTTVMAEVLFSGTPGAERAELEGRCRKTIEATVESYSSAWTLAVLANMMLQVALLYNHQLNEQKRMVDRLRDAAGKRSGDGETLQ